MSCTTPSDTTRPGIPFASNITIHTVVRAPLANGRNVVVVRTLRGFGGEAAEGRRTPRSSDREQKLARESSTEAIGAVPNGRVNEPRMWVSRPGMASARTPTS
ncbi:hypothetical protein [Methylobacterium sp. Leaf456]|uniref:hypothetical protein n=1 Tax=Methylobacterium sp. Leaf456 TaxID=1736382 RepID=UPI0012E3E2F7|nr:hypothetical protein [Methylobacterium sp. Leaf456]